MFTIRIETTGGRVIVTKTDTENDAMDVAGMLLHSPTGWRLIQVWSGMTCLHEVTK